VHTIYALKSKLKKVGKDIYIGFSLRTLNPIYETVRNIEQYLICMTVFV